MKSTKQRRRGICPHCRSFTHHVLEWKYQAWDLPSGKRGKRAHDDAMEDLTERRSYYVARCERCKELLLYINDPPHDDICDNFEGSDEAETILVWPELSDLSEAVPERVRYRYNEAAAVRERSLNSFATNIRRALEALCADKGMVKAPLDKQLQALAFANELSPRFAEITDVLRVIGNIGSHDDRDVTFGEAQIIEKCFRLLVQYFYELPAEIRHLRETLAALAERDLDGTEEVVDSMNIKKIQ